jgi:hypothetical protein
LTTSPSIVNDLVTAAALVDAGAYAYVASRVNSSSLTIVYDANLPAGTNGTYAEGVMTLRPGMSALKLTSAFVHEFNHHVNAAHYSLEDHLALTSNDFNRAWNSARDYEIDAIIEEIRVLGSNAGHSYLNATEIAQAIQLTRDRGFDPNTNTAALKSALKDVAAQNSNFLSATFQRAAGYFANNGKGSLVPTQPSFSGGSGGGGENPYPGTPPSPGFEPPPPPPPPPPVGEWTIGPTTPPSSPTPPPPPEPEPPGGGTEAIGSNAFRGKVNPEDVDSGGFVDTTVAPHESIHMISAAFWNGLNDLNAFTAVSPIAAPPLPTRIDVMASSLINVQASAFATTSAHSSTTAIDVNPQSPALVLPN